MRSHDDFRDEIRAHIEIEADRLRARFYNLTKSGRKQLVEETTQWRRLAAAIGRVLGPAGEES